MVNLFLIVTVGLALVAGVDAEKAGDACKGADACDGKLVGVTTTVKAAAASTSTTTTTTKAPVTCAQIQCGVNCPAGLKTLTDHPAPLGDAGLGAAYEAATCAQIVPSLKESGMKSCGDVPQNVCSMWTQCGKDPLILANRCPVACGICEFTPITTANATTANATAAPATTANATAAPAPAPAPAPDNSTTSSDNSTNSSRMLLEDDVFGEAPARELGAHLMCQCTAAPVSTTVPAGKKAVQVERHVVEGKMGFNFSSTRRLEVIDEDFVALSRKLLTVAQVQPHIQAGLQQTVHNDTEVTKCDKQDAADVFHTIYQIPCASAAAAQSVTTSLGDVAKPGGAFNDLKAAVAKSATASSITLTISGPPSVLEAPQTTKKMVTIFLAADATGATTTAETQVSGACSPKAVGLLMGLAVLAAAAN